jgi:uncharacterized protein
LEGILDTLSLFTGLFLCGGGFLAGFVDSIAGGGGIISLPILLSVGIPPHQALGTNKLQGSFGSFTAALNYARKGLVDYKKIVPGIIFTAMGAILGTVAIQMLSAAFLQHVIPLLLAAVFLYTLFTPDMGRRDSKPKMNERLFYLLAGLILGFYDGFFGPGTGSFWTLLFVLFLGLDLKKATAHTKITNFTSNIVALTVFVIGGKVLFLAGIIMGCGQMAGAYTGSRLVIRNGVGFVRVFFLAVVAVTIARLLYVTYF